MGNLRLPQPKSDGLDYGDHAMKGSFQSSIGGFMIRSLQYRTKTFLTLLLLLIANSPPHTFAWHDETHIAIAKVTGYPKWFNACGPDMIKMKASEVESGNHYVNNPPGTVVTSKRVMNQISSYNLPNRDGHLYGAIIASLRDYLENKRKGKYGEYHLAFCAHYVGDLSMPLHNTHFNEFNKEYHSRMDGVINNEVLENLEKIRIYPIHLHSEADLAKEIARIANLTMKLGYRVEKENRNLTKEEAYRQISHSASLFKAILEYVKKELEKSGTPIK
jgi:hypothetical protein